MTTELSTLTENLIENIGKALLGKRDAVKLALVAFLSDGHLLIEDAPGVGKTSLAKAIAQSVHCKFTRLQFTPDMLPSDILGTTVYKQQQGEFEFREGPVFTNVLLADEINRTTPRTQSALLEAMSEKQVSIDGVTYQLDRPFFVLATQNPFEFEGTYPLPENQLDRFMLRIEIGYPSRDVERDVLHAHHTSEPLDHLEAVINQQQLLDLQKQVRNVKVDDSICEYLLNIIEATRNHNELALGVSPRGTITFYRAVQGKAFIEGRNFVTPDDVKAMAGPVLAHRIVIKGMMREVQRERANTIIQQLLHQLPVPN